MAWLAFRVISCLGVIVSFAAAQQTSIVSLILPAYDAQTIDASVVEVGATATTYFITCPTGEASDQCGLADGSTIIDGPSVLEWDIQDAIGSMHVSCAISGDTASCTESMSQTGMVSQTATVISQLSDYALPVTITAGLDKLSSSGRSLSGLATATTNPTTSGSISSITQATSTASSGSVAGSASSSTHTGGGPMATKNAILVGAAAGLGLVMIA